MEYLTLKQLFHMDEKKCNEIYTKRFESESTKRLDITLGDYECFYVLTDELLKLIVDIYKINQWFENNIKSFSYAKTFLIQKSLIEEIGSSNKVEGIYSTRKEISDLMTDPNPPKRYKRFYGMVKKYQKLLTEEKVMIESCLQVRELYDEILLKDVLNEDENDALDGVFFRAGPVNVESSSTKVIHSGIVGEKNIIITMDKALKILNDENINLLIRVPLFHYLFEYIHPFYNGNGRMGRFLATAYLTQELDVLCALQLSIACHYRINDYYKIFKTTNDVRNKSDLTPFIIGFLEIYDAGLKALKESTIQTKYQYTSLKDKMKPYYDHKYNELMDVLLQDTLFGLDGIPMQLLVKTLNKTEQRIRSIIKEINAVHPLIEINHLQKPYRYRINIDYVQQLK